MRMADSLARELGAEVVTDEHIRGALEEQDYRLNYLVEQSDQGVIDGQILLQTDGEEIGQINGLSVIQVSGHPYDFGEPVRLTAPYTLVMAMWRISSAKRSWPVISTPRR